MNIGFKRRHIDYQMMLIWLQTILLYCHLHFQWLPLWECLKVQFLLSGIYSRKNSSYIKEYRWNVGIRFSGSIDRNFRPETQVKSTRPDRTRKNCRLFDPWKKFRKTNILCKTNAIFFQACAFFKYFLIFLSFEKIWYDLENAPNELFLIYLT